MTNRTTNRMSCVDERAWAAVLTSNPGALDVALIEGASPNSKHPLGHTLIEQAAKSQLKASLMCAVLIARGAAVAKPDEPFAFELAARAIFEDSPVLAKHLLNSSHEWPVYLKNQRSLLSIEDPENPSQLETFMKAVYAAQSIGQYGQRIAKKTFSMLQC